MTQTIAMRAAGDISASHQRAVRISDEYQVNTITNANAPHVAFGILTNKPNAAGEGADIAVQGRARAELGGTVSAGNALSTNNSGDLIAAPWEAAIGTADLYIFAIALEDGADTEIIDVWLFGVAIPGSTE